MKRNYKIYMHKNKINGKVYIGQTYTDLQSRFGKNGIRYKSCPLFYNAIQKYGWENFEHIILEENIDNSNIANEKEKYYISLYNSTNNNYGYNIQNGGCEQTKLSIPVHQYSLDGLYIKSYASISDANRENNIASGKISECCHNNRKSIGGFMWSFKKENSLNKYKRKSKEIYKYDLKGNYICTYTSISDIVKEFNLSSSVHIYDCCNGNRSSCCGYIWSYEKHNKILTTNFHKQGFSIQQYDLNGKFLKEFDNLVEASKQFGEKANKAYSSINNCLNNKSKTAYGYIWKYTT